MSLSAQEIVEKIKLRGDADSLQEKRESFAYLTSFSSVPDESGVTFEDHAFQARDGVKIRARVYQPELASTRVVFFFHGGGFVCGSLYTHHAALMNLASGCKACFVHVDYRLAPEFKFPTAFHDACDGIRDFSARFEPQHILVCGDSAGGNLAAAIAQELKSEIHAQILLYPTLDSSFEAASWREMSDNPIANPKVSGELNHLYARSRADEASPQFSPLKAGDLSGLAPCFVFAGSQDAAKGDGQAYVANMKAAGGEATYREFKGAIHGFLNMTDVLEESRQLHDEIRAVIHKF